MYDNVPSVALSWNLDYLVIASNAVVVILIIAVNILFARVQMVVFPNFQ